MCKFLYFSFSVVYGYWVAYDSYFLPPSLGGKGDIDKMWTDFPYQGIETFPYIRGYLMIQLGYHLQSFIVHVCSKPRNDFMEMLLHHSLAVWLIALAYFMNYVIASHLVLFTHDLPDLFVYLTRTLMDTNQKKLTIFSYGSIMISWFYMRLYIFPVDIMRVSAYSNPIRDKMYGLPIMEAMVYVLLVMHVYWFILLAKMGWRFASTGVGVDTMKDLKEEN